MVLKKFILAAILFLCSLTGKVYSLFVDDFSLQDQIFETLFFPSYNQFCVSHVANKKKHLPYSGNSKELKLAGLTKDVCMLPGVYQIESCACIPEQQGWLCGLHFLYNICELEKFLNINQVTDAQFLKHSYAHPEILDSRGAYPSDIQIVAQQLIKSPLYFFSLDKNDGHVCELFGLSEDKVWQTVDRYFARSGLRCVHFGCIFEEKECHIFLVSVVKYGSEKFEFYILDSENEYSNVPERVSMSKLIKYIYDHLIK